MMSKHGFKAWLASCMTLGVAALALTTPARGEGDARVMAMQQRLDQLEQEVATLRAQLPTEQTWMTARRAEEVKALVHEVLADADLRASLRDDAAVAGWKNGFFIGSADGNYLLRLRALIMARYMYSHQDESPVDDDRGGFELARTRFGFQGHVIDPSWQYFIWTGYNDQGGAVLLDAYVKKTLGAGFSLTAGQFKLPFWREWLISETRLPMIERSQLNVFSGGYAQGLQIGWESPHVRLTGAYTDGTPSANSLWSVEDTEYAFTGRAEGLVWGKWEQYGENEAWAGDEPMLVFGLAGHYQVGEWGTTHDETEILRWTADATLKRERCSMMAAIVGNHQSNGASKDQYGVLVGGGYFLTPEVELHVRYEWGDSDQAGDADLSILTVGIDRHWAKHQVRFLFDVGYAFNPVAAFWVNSMTGYREDAKGEDGQIVVRSQLQLAF